MKILGRVCAALTIVVAAAFLLPAQPFAQGTVLQSGPMVPGHVPMYLNSGGNSQATLFDSGPAGGAAIGYGLSEKLLQARGPGTGPFGAHDCDWDTYATNPAGAHFLCFDANANGGGLIAYGAQGPASPLPFNIIANGVPLLPTGGPLPFVVVTASPYNAKCDNATDDSAAINSALSSGAKAVIIPAGVMCAFTQTLTVPDGVNFYQAAFNPNPNSPPRGQTSGLRCSALVCIVAGANDNGTPILHDLTIYRSGSAGSAPNGSICIQWNGDANAVAYNIWCQNNAIEYQIKSTGVAGAYFFGTNLFTCGTADADVDIVQVPGVYFTGGVLGCNGAFDVNSNDAVRVEGNWDNAKGTVHFNQVQINKGQNAATCAFDFKNFTGTANQFLDFEVIGGHVEAVDNFMCSDSSVASFASLNISNLFTVGGNGSNHFFSLNPATSIEFTDIHDLTNFGWGDLTLAPSVLLSQLKIHDNDFQMPVHITGTGGVIWMGGNTYNGTLTIDGTWGVGNVNGNFIGGSQVFSDSALTKLDIRLPNISCPLNLAIGGSSSGITYNGSTFSHCDLANKKLNVQFFLPIESLGGLTGAATITGLPFRGNNVALAQAPILTANLTGTGTTGIFVGPQATQRLLTVSTFTSTGNSTPLADPVFANANGSCTTTCPILSGEISYTVGGN